MLSRSARRFGQPHRSNGASATLCGSLEVQRQCVDGVPLQFFVRRGHRCFPDVQQQPQPSLDVFSPIVVAATVGVFQGTTQNPGLHLTTRSVTASGRRLSAPRRGQETGSRAETGRRRHLPRRPTPFGRGRGLQVKPRSFCVRPSEKGIFWLEHERSSATVLRASFRTRGCSDVQLQGDPDVSGSHIARSAFSATGLGRRGSSEARTTWVRTTNRVRVETPPRG